VQTIITSAVHELADDPTIVCPIEIQIDHRDAAHAVYDGYPDVVYATLSELLAAHGLDAGALATYLRERGDLAGAARVEQADVRGANDRVGDQEVPTAYGVPVEISDAQHEGTRIMRGAHGYQLTSLDWDETTVHERCALVRLRGDYPRLAKAFGPDVPNAWTYYLPNDCEYGCDLAEGLLLVGCRLRDDLAPLGEILWDSAV
jgi:hypothetical protein